MNGCSRQNPAYRPTPFSKIGNVATLAAGAALMIVFRNIGKRALT